MQIDTSRERSRLVAVLGPTNTGKTHLAMERMLGHPTGMIGFPLRLLARENYDRAVRSKGRTRVALITGEEKIVPAGAQYFLCTVEAMPLAREVSFLAIDEIQMCADADRGHVFTDRLLHARGSAETMFLGAETIRPLIRRLVPGIDFISRPRFSTLSYIGHRKITRLPARSAVVAFSAGDVYAIAETIRRVRGGAAVVLGALSPRTRNAQVGLYQAGEVDYLVATDAIGMGLNMDVGHVAFASRRKFDGTMMRALTAAELAQIGGRAGRHMNDGTFGTTNDEGPLDPTIVESIESHAFEPLKHLFWRNEALGFQSIEALQASLAVAPEIKGLVRARADDDERALALLVRDAEIAGLARTPDAVRLLWEVCRIPDFSKVSVEAHAALLGRVYRHLAGPDGRLPTDWIAERVAQIDRIDGDIETIAGRIAQIRTWTTIAFHGDWLTDAAHWQGRTRDVEDRLSDALHDGLTKRFVDKRTAVLMRQLKERHDLVVAVQPSGEVEVEGQFVGHLAGFRFTADGNQGPEARMGARKAIHAAAERALMREISARIERLEADGDDAFAFGTVAAWDRIEWRGEAVARMVPGAHVLSPAVEPLPGGLLEPGGRERVRRRLAGWLDAVLKRDLAPLYDLGTASLTGAARGLAFRLAEELGTLPRATAAEQIKALNRSDRQALRRLGVRLGRESVYIPTLLKARAVALRGMLWGLGKDLAALPLPDPGRVSLKAENEAQRRFLEAVGYRATGPLSVRIDMIERLAGRAWSLSRDGPFPAAPDLLSIAGCGADDLGGILGALGYRQVSADGVVAYSPKRGRKPRAKQPPTAAADSDSPFAKLKDLVSS